MNTDFKVMTYNIHFTIGTDGVPDWRRIAALIRKENPDLLGLEEVTVNHPKTPGLNVPEEMSRALGMDVFFGKAIDINEGKGEYGIAALTRNKMTVIDKIYLPTPDGIEKRVFLIVRVQMERPIYFIVTHFSYQGEFPGDEEYRIRSAKLVTETLKKNNYLPAVWVGDFNTYPGSATLDYIHTEWDVCNDRDTETVTARCMNAGWRQIDFICTCPKGAFDLKEFVFIDDMLASDHRPVTALLHLK